MHLVTSAKIHVFSSVSAPPLETPGWNAIFLPGCNGNCFDSASLRDLYSRKIDPVGDGRAGRVIETPRLLPAWLATDTDVTDGEGPRGRFRFSIQV